MTTATPTTARRALLVTKPRCGVPGLLKLVHYTPAGRTCTEYAIREVGAMDFAGRGFECCRVHACEFDPATSVFVYLARDGRFSDPADAEGGELVEALTALINADML